MADLSSAQRVELGRDSSSCIMSIEIRTVAEVLGRSAKLKERKHLRGNLNDQPAHHCVGNRDLVNIAPLQFAEQ